MPYPDVVLLWNYWQQYPPKHVLMAAYFGYPKNGRAQAPPQMRPNREAAPPESPPLNPMERISQRMEEQAIGRENASAIKNAVHVSRLPLSVQKAISERKRPKT